MGSLCFFTKLTALILFSSTYLFQLYSIAQNYFEYPVFSRVDYLSPQNDVKRQFPAFTFCSKAFKLNQNHSELINIPQLPREISKVPICRFDYKHKVNCLFKFINGSDYVQTDEKLPAKRDKNAYLAYSPKSLYAHFVLNSIAANLLIDNLTIQNNKLIDRMFYTRFYWNSMFCYTVNNKNVSINYLEDDKMLIKLELNTSLLSQRDIQNQILFLLSEPGIEFNSFNFFGTTTYVPLKQNFSVYITYTKYITKTLESPYKSRCVDYSKFNLKSQQDCISKCILNSYHFTGIPLYDAYDTRRGTLGYLPDESYISMCKKH